MSLTPRVLIGLAVLLVACVVACSKPEQGGAPSSDSAKGATPATAAPSAAAASTGASSAAAEKNAPSASASATVAAGDAGATCGTKPLPDCPLQAWMKQNPNTALNGNDMPALATSLDKLVGFAPAGYTNWASIAKDGAKAANAGDTAAAKASCRSCHDQYKQKYKTEMRTRAI
jgi:hypothetical protein